MKELKEREIIRENGERAREESEGAKHNVAARVAIGGAWK
jgi:hypothetical protein